MVFFFLNKFILKYYSTLKDNHAGCNWIPAGRKTGVADCDESHKTQAGLSGAAALSSLRKRWNSVATSGHEMLCHTLKIALGTAASGVK